MYKYGNTEDVKVGSIVHNVSSSYGTINALYIIKSKDEKIALHGINYPSWSKRSFTANFKLIITKPGNRVKLGDYIIRTKNKSEYTYNDRHMPSEVEIVEAIRTSDGAAYVKGKDIAIHSRDFLVLCKEEQPPKHKEVNLPNQYPKCTLNVMDIRKTQMENTMENITVTMTAKEFAKRNRHPMTAKVLTQFKSRLPITMVVYTAEEAYEATTYHKSLKKAEKARRKFLQQPANLGKKVVLHKALDVLTTNLPLVTC